MRKTLFLAALAVWLCAASGAHAQEYMVRAAANTLVHDSFVEWTRQVPCARITDFSSPYANRGTVELVLACQALDISGCGFTVRPVKYPHYQAALMQALDGKTADMAAETVWDDDPHLGDFFTTEPIIPAGTFEKGVYVRPEAAPYIKVRSALDLRALRPVMLRSWYADWRTMGAMGLAPLDVSHKELLFRTIKSREADFTLLEFSSAEDMAQAAEGISLVPVPGVKVGLCGARVFAVSKNAPNGVAIYHCLERGLSVLRERGVIDRALRESGFYQSRVRDWNKLN